MGRRLSAALLLAALATAAAAATAPPLTAQAPAASPYLPQDHWVHSVLRRLAAAGAVEPTGVVGRRSVTQAEAVRALRAAVEAGEASGNAAERAATAEAAGALSRFLAEFPLADPARETATGVSGRGLLGAEGREGSLRTGTGYGIYDIPRWPPVPGEDFRGVRGTLELSAQTGWLGATAEAGYAAGNWRALSLHAVARLGPALLWGGRRPVGFGPGDGGGIVLGDELRVDGGGVQLVAPLEAPGFLGFLGPIHFETLVGRMGPSGQVENPWFWAARGSVQPHPRLLLGINRGALFGGEGNLGTTFRDLAYILIGKHAAGGSGIENQVVSVDVVYRPPVPVGSEVYVEWGLEDSAGAFRDVPGTLWGFALYDPPGLPAVRLGLERTDFARSCCGNPIWYRHMFLYAGWTDDGVPMGHPLGGHGEEWRVFASRGFLGQRLQARAALAFRDRWHENLYAPDREGSSQLAMLRASYGEGRWSVAAELAGEAGDGWSESVFEMFIGMSF